MTGGEAGQNRAEKKLAAETDTWIAKSNELMAAAKARHEQKQLKSRLDNMWETTAKNTRSRQSGAMFDFIGGKANDALSIGKNLLSAPMDIYNGMKDSPIAQAQRQLAMANITKGFGEVPKMEEKKPRKFNDVKSFGAEQSGSLAAYQQRVRGAQQFDKVEVKQLDELKGIRSAIEKNPLVLASVGAR